MKLGRAGLALVAMALLACNQPDEKEAAPEVEPPPPPILLDGSSTVHPISEAVLDLYASRLVTDVELDFSGTGGGFKKFCRKETTINGASRPIAPTESKLCQENAVEYIELPIAFDGVAVVVPTSNDFVDVLTVQELEKIWSPAAQGSVNTWQDVRASFPDVPLKLFGPGIDSGTFDFFTEAILGSASKSRADYTSSESDAELVTKIHDTKGALGYFGLSHYMRNESQLKALAIDDQDPKNGEGPIELSPAAVTQGTYQPLSRPLFIYVRKGEAEREEVADFVNFYLRSARLVAPDVGAVGLSRHLFDLVEKRFEERVTGSAFSGLTSVVGLTLSELLEAETVAVESSVKVAAAGVEETAEKEADKAPSEPSAATAKDEQASATPVTPQSSDAAAAAKKAATDETPSTTAAKPPAAEDEAGSSE